MSRIVSEQEFHNRLFHDLVIRAYGGARERAVTGPGRSGAIASVYASHILGIPWIPYGQSCPLKPVLIVDTAAKTGRTLRKALTKYRTDRFCVPFSEPPRVRFWYES